MADATPVFGWPRPQSSDKIAQIATIVASAITGIENSFNIPNNSKSVADTYDTYPKGVSLLALSSAGATNGAWPENFSGYVLTLKRAFGDAACQFHITNRTSGTATVRFRNGNDNGWTSWIIIGGPGQPAATASGTVTFLNNSTTQTKTVAFPSGRFPSAPNVSTSAHGIGAVGYIQSISTTSMTVGITPIDGSSSSTADRYVDWIAMVNY